MSNEDNDCSLA